jgi:hypothetical protein
MSTGRLKDQKDFDLEQIVQVIDQALESDDQRIKDALRALMTITVLCTAEHPDQMLRNGPLARVFEDMRNLNQRLGRLEDDLNKIKWDQQKRQVEPFTPPYNPGSPFGPIGTPTTSKPTPMWGPSWSAGDDPNYKGASSGMLAEDFIKELEKR